MSKERNRAGAAALLALLAGLNIISGKAAADTIPGTAYAGSHFYFSAEMDPVTVSFGAAGSSAARFEIPRAYIFYASGYSQERHETLPAEIDVGKLGLMLTFPDGEPYGFAVRNYKWHDDPHKRAATEALRERRYIALIDQAEDPASYAAPPRDTQGRLHESYSHAGRNYGMDHYRTQGGGEYFFGGAEDGLLQASCVKDSGDRTFCKYFIALGGNTVAIVSFLDFRYHGEREYLDARVRVFRAALCPYFDCTVARPPGE